MKKKYSVETNITKVKDTLNLQYPSYIIDFQSENETNNVRALESLQALLVAIDMKFIENHSGNQRAKGESHQENRKKQQKIRGK